MNSKTFLMYVRSVLSESEHGIGLLSFIIPLLGKFQFPTELYKRFYTYLLEMYPSFGSARFDSVLTRVFKEKARLGSARSLSLKTRSMEKAQNESF